MLVMEGVELAIPMEVSVAKLMGSEVLVGARVCATEGEARESDRVSPFCAPKILEWSSLISDRGISSASESYSQIKKTDTELYRVNNLLSRLETEDSSRGLDHGIISGSTASISGSEGKPIQRKLGKVQRNGNSPFKKLRMSQADNLLLQAETDDAKIEWDKLGSQLVKCSNADKSQVGQQKSAINGRRGDRRNSKVPVKAKYDSFLLRAGLPTFSPASGGSNAFGMHGLKPDVHDVTKLIDDISLDKLLDGSYTFPNLSKDTGNKAANVNENILDSVMKACSILRLQGLQQNKQTEETDVHVDKKTPLLSSPSNTSAADSPDGDQSSLATGLSKCSKDQESCMEATAPADMYNGTCFYQPRDILERLALPPPKDLESLLQEAVKPAPALKLDSRSPKPLSTRVSLPPFTWSHSFNGHHKSNNDAIKASHRNTCQGRWARIRSGVSIITGGGGTESFVDMDSFTYDDSLIPPGKLKYILPEIERSSSTVVAQHCSQHNVTSAECSTVPQPSSALHCPRVVAAAQTLCDMATHSSKPNSNGILKWPKLPSQKAMKARKSRSSEKPEEEFPIPKSETTHLYEVRGGEKGSSSTKKPKLSVVERRQDFSHIQTVIGLTSVCAPRSSRSSPLKFSKDSVGEARTSNNGGFSKPPFTVLPPPPRVLDRSTQNNPHNKVRKVAQMDWNRTRS